jgi:hypothetical protein
MSFVDYYINDIAYILEPIDRNLPSMGILGRRFVIENATPMQPS